MSQFKPNDNETLLALAIRLAFDNGYEHKDIMDVVAETLHNDKGRGRPSHISSEIPDELVDFWDEMDVVLMALRPRALGPYAPDDDGNVTEENMQLMMDWKAQLLSDEEVALPR